MSVNVVNFYLAPDPVHVKVVKALYDGCPEKKVLRSVEDYEPSDIAVVFGVYKSRVQASHARGRIISQQRQKKCDVIVLETGYINRGDGDNHHYAAGFNGLNGRADFKNHGMPADRSEKLGVRLKPWKEAGEHVLLCGQIPWDASVDHVNIQQWLLDAVNLIRGRTTREIIFRPHPLTRVPALGGTRYSTRPLVDDLAKAHCCVTFNSNSAVEAAIAGVPVIAYDEGSMAYTIAGHDWRDVEDPPKPDRKQWLYDLCYTQWTLDEMREGLAWRPLFR